MTLNDVNDSIHIANVKIEHGGAWCYFVHDYVSCYGSKEINYDGTTIHIRLYVEENENYDLRMCNLIISSYYGGLRDSVFIQIEQKGLGESEHIHLRFEQSRYLTSSEYEYLSMHDQPYNYTLRISSDDYPNLQGQDCLAIHLCGVGDFFDRNTWILHKVFQCYDGTYIPFVPYMVANPLNFNGSTFEYNYSENTQYVINQFHANFDTCEIEIPENSPLSDYVIDTEFLEI